MDLCLSGQFEVVTNAFKVIDIASPINIELSPEDTVSTAHEEFFFAIDDEMHDDWFALVKDQNRIFGYLAYDGEYFCGDENPIENNTPLLNVVEPITPEIIVPSTMPLLELIPLFERSYFFFALTRNTISHVVSFNDLDKQPVKLSLFSLLMELETNIIQLLLYSGDAEKYLSFLPADRIKRIEKFIKPKYNHDGIEYKLLNTNFWDKGLMLSNFPGFYDQMNYENEDDFKKHFKSIKDVRNKIAHGDSFLKILDKPVKLNKFLINLIKAINVISGLNNSLKDGDENCIDPTPI